MALLNIAGRMHKPTLTLVSRAPEVQAAQQANLSAAAAAALLLLPPRFSTKVGAKGGLFNPAPVVWAAVLHC